MRRSRNHAFSQLARLIKRISGGRERTFSMETGRAPFVLQKQKSALRFAGTFAPKSKFSMFLRNQVMNLMRIPLIADLAAGRELAYTLTLPDYG
jgi:hypothetical protein